jgi:hypothetical protein
VAYSDKNKCQAHFLQEQTVQQWRVLDFNSGRRFAPQSNSIGIPGRNEYKRVDALIFGMSPTYFNDIDYINFAAAIERIRITGPIPEPATIVLICSALCVISIRRQRRRWPGARVPATSRSVVEYEK